MDSFVNFLVVNIPFWLVLAFLIFRVVAATKRGMVKEICSLIATLAGCISILVIAFAVRNYIHNNKLLFVITLVLLAIFGMIYKMIDGLLTTMKLIAKLPVVKTADKLLGVVVGIIETIIVVWTLFCIIMIMDGGMIERVVLECVNQNIIMRKLFEYNYLYVIISPFSDRLRNIDIDKLTDFML